MQPTIEYIHDIDTGSDPVLMHTPENEAFVFYVKNGRMFAVKTTTPLGNWNNNIFSNPTIITMVRFCHEETDGFLDREVMHLNTKRTTGTHSWLVWKSKDRHRIAIYPFDPGLCYDLVYGPTTLGLNSKEKRVRRIHFVVSKEPEATMYVSYAVTRNGPFLPEKEILPGQGVTKLKTYLPILPGNPAGGFVYRIRIRGFGNVKVHEIALELSPRG